MRRFFFNFVLGDKLGVLEENSLGANGEWGGQGKKEKHETPKV
jgi:hypothetical protein